MDTVSACRYVDEMRVSLNRVSQSFELLKYQFGMLLESLEQPELPNRALHFDNTLLLLGDRLDELHKFLP